LEIRNKNMMKAIFPSTLQNLITYLIASYATEYFPTVLKKNQFGRKKNKKKKEEPELDSCS